MPWPIASLGEVVTINPRGESLCADDEVSFVGMAELDAETAVARARETRAFSDVSKGYTIFRDRDVLAAKITPCWENGKVGQARLGHAVGVGSTEFHVLRPSNAVDDRYLLHFLRQPSVRRDGERRMTGSAGQRRVPVAFLADLKLPLPPIEEQRRIADILDRADALRAKRREALALLDDLTQSIFLYMFRGGDWPRTPLRELAAKITKGTTPTSVGLTFEESGVPFLRVMDLVGGLAVPSDRTLHISEASHEVLARSKILGGEVLISIAGTIGRVATVPAGLPEMNCNQAVAIVSVGSQVELDYLAAWLRGTDAGRQMGSGSVTATIANLSLKEVGDLQVPLPPRELQREFAARACVLVQNRLAYEVLVARQEALFTSLQQRAFAGQL